MSSEGENFFIHWKATFLFHFLNKFVLFSRWIQVGDFFEKRFTALWDSSQDFGYFQNERFRLRDYKATFTQAILGLLYALCGPYHFHSMFTLDNAV